MLRVGYQRVLEALSEHSFSPGSRESFLWGRWLPPTNHSLMDLQITVGFGAQHAYPILFSIWEQVCAGSLEVWWGFRCTLCVPFRDILVGQASGRVFVQEIELPVRERERFGPSSLAGGALACSEMIFQGKGWGWFGLVFAAVAAMAPNSVTAMPIIVWSNSFLPRLCSL